MAQFSYFAFISYSHVDKLIAKRLQKKIERLRIPWGLDAALPEGLEDRRYLEPIFRDADDLPPAHSLTDEIKSQLDRSRYLIVLCTPDAAASDWVSQEVEYFQSIGRGHMVLPVLARGEPRVHSQETPNGAFTPSLIRYSETASRDIPIAANMTGGRKTRDLETLKIAAKLLDVDPKLFTKQREADRRSRAIMWGTPIAATLVLAGYIAFSQWLERRETWIRELTEQSEKLAKLAENLTQSGDDAEAVALAIAALPDERSGKLRPYVAQAEAALHSTLSRLNVESVLRGHRDEIVSIAVSPASDVFGSGSVDGTARLWAMAKPGEAAHVLAGDGSPVLSTSFLDGGAMFVTGSASGSVRVYDTRSGALLFEPKSHKAAVTKLVPSPDGEIVATLSRDGTAHLLDISTGAVQVLPHIDPDWKVVGGWGAKDGTRWADTDLSTSADFWGLLRPRNLWYRGQGVTAAQWSADGDYIATAGQDGRLRVWSRSGNSSGMPIKVDDEPIFDMLADFDADRIAVGTLGLGSIWTFSGERVAEISAGPWQGRRDRSFALVSLHRVTETEFVAQMLTQQSRATVEFIWRLNDGKWIGTPQFPKSTGRPINVLTADRSANIIGDGIGSIEITSPFLQRSSQAPLNLVRLSFLDREDPLILVGHRAPVSALAIVPGGLRVVSGDVNGEIRIWRTFNLDNVRAHAGASENPMIMMLAGSAAPDGSLLATVSSRNRARIYVMDADPPYFVRLERSVVAVSGVAPGGAAERAGIQVDDVILSIDGKKIGDADMVSSLVRLKSGSQLEFVVSRAGRPLSMKVTPVAQMVADDAGVEAPRGAVGIQITNVSNPDDEVTAIHVSPSGDKVFAGSSNGAVLSWPIPDRRDLTQEPRLFGRLTGDVIHLSTIRNGTQIVAISRLGEVATWNIETEEPVSKVETDLAPHVVSVARDGSRVLVATNTGEGKIIALDGAGASTDFRVHVVDRIPDASFSPDGRFAFVLSQSETFEGRINRIDVGNGAIKSVEVPDVYLSAVGPRDATRVYAFGRDYKIRDIDIESGRVVKELPFLATEASQLIVSANGRRLNAFGDGMIRVYDVGSGHLLREWVTSRAGGAPAVAKVAAFGEDDVIISAAANHIFVSRLPPSTQSLIDQACIALPAVYRTRPIEGLDRSQSELTICDGHALPAADPSAAQQP